MQAYVPRKLKAMPWVEEPRLDDEEDPRGPPKKTKKGWLTSYTNRLSRFGWLVCVSAMVLAIYGTVLIVLGLRGNLDGFDYYYSFLFGLSCVFMVFPYAALQARVEHGVAQPADADIKLFLHRSRYWFYEWIGQLFFVFSLIHLALSIIVVKYTTVGPRDQLLNVYTIMGSLAALGALMYLYGMSGQSYAVSFAFLSLLLISNDVTVPMLGLGIAAVVITCWLIFRYMQVIAHDLSYHLTVGTCTAISFLFTFFQNYEDWLDVPTSQYHPVMISGLILAMTRALWAYIFGFMTTGDQSDTKTVDPVMEKPQVAIADTSTLDLSAAPANPKTVTA